MPIEPVDPAKAKRRLAEKNDSAATLLAGCFFSAFTLAVDRFCHAWASQWSVLFSSLDALFVF